MNNEVVFDIPDSSDYRKQIYDTADVVLTVQKVSRIPMVRIISSRSTMEHNQRVIGGWPRSTHFLTALLLCGARVGGNTYPFWVAACQDVLLRT